MFQTLKKLITENRSVVIRNVGDGWISRGDKTKLVFDQSKVVVADNWNKNGIYYNFNQNLFPNAQHIILLSHPCDYKLFYQFPKADWYVQQHFSKYFDEFNVKLINQPDTIQLRNYIATSPHYMAYNNEQKDIVLRKYHPLC